MGAWGIGAFENDFACDWSYDLEGTSDLSLIEETLTRVFDEEEEYLDSDVASEAIAACEVLAKLRGHQGVSNAYTETVDAWVAANQSLDPTPLLPLALKALDRIVGPDSEITELWFETEDAEKWQASVQALRAKLA